MKQSKMKISKKQASEIIKHRVNKAQINPPANWEKWNKENSELFKTGASISHIEYNEVFFKNDFAFLK